ncbi:TPA: hypothetical protein ACGY71_001349 [Stenotrophomonas maltophilia]
MSDGQGWKQAIAAIAIVALAGCSVASDANTYALYRSSTVLDGRIHVATFDAKEDEGYNRDNCETARGLFQGQPGVEVRYWCEKGRFRP